MNWITEERYEERMQREAEPYLEARREAGFDERVPGETIYYEHYRADAPKGVIVISHGFTESVRKFTESIYYMLQTGYEVWGLDHRGHGRSVRQNENPYVVHVERFHDYVLDLVHLVETRVKPAAGMLPVYLYCHSMGGCVGAWTIEEYPGLFDKAVLSSPMLGLSFGKIPVPVAYLAASLKGVGEKRKEPLSPVEAFNEAEPDFLNSCDSSEQRYLYYHKKRLADRALQTCAPSIQWGKQAVLACARVTSKRETAKVRIPVLLCQAGADTVVVNPAQELFAARVKGCELYRVPDRKHELYMSDDAAMIPYWEKVFAFLGKEGKEETDCCTSDVGHWFAMTEERTRCVFVIASQCAHWRGNPFLFHMIFTESGVVQALPGAASARGILRSAQNDRRGQGESSLRSE